MHGNNVLHYTAGTIERKVKGKGIRIIVPHDWERNAVAPLIEVLKKNIDVLCVDMPQSRARILETSRKLRQAGIGKEHDEVRAALFKLEDLLKRVADIERALAIDPGCAVVELHCMQKNNHKWDGFVWEDYYVRVMGTDVIVPKDTISGAFLTPLNDVLDFLDQRQPKAKQVCGFFDGLDLGRVLGERGMFLHGSAMYSEKIGLIELPIRPRRPIVPLLYSMKNDVWPRTDFEERHLTWESAPRQLREKEIKAALSLF